MKQNQEFGSIYPTIGICGTQKTEALDLNTSSNLGASGSGNSRRGRASNDSDRKKKLLNIHSITGFGTPQYFGGKNIQSPCPFCLGSNLLFITTRKNYHSQRKVKMYYCQNCKKSHSITRYIGSHHPDYVISTFLDVIKEIKINSPTNITREVYKRCNYKISYSGANKLIKKYNKGKLYPYRIPNSRLNKINKQEVSYISKTKWRRELTLKTKKAMQFLQGYNNHVISRRVLSQSGNYNYKDITTIQLITQGLVKHIGKGMYYVDLKNG